MDPSPASSRPSTPGSSRPQTPTTPGGTATGGAAAKARRRKAKRRGSKKGEEPPLVQMPSVRQGPVLQSPDVKHPHYGDRTILEWPEEGRQLAMGGPLAEPPKRGAAAYFANKPETPPPPKASAKAGGAIRIGDRIVRLPDKPEDPRVARRKRRLPPDRALLPHDPLRAPDAVWEACAAGRGSASERFKQEPTFGVLSYQVLSQGRAQEMGHIKDSVRASAARRERLLEEVLGYASDVVCLQDVDFAADFWQPKLGVAGYDVVFHRRSAHCRPRGPTSEGVLVAWDRDLFTLVKSEAVDLNDQFEGLRSEDPALAMEALTDDVAVMVLLCPWQDGVFPAPLCVCSALLLDGAANPKAEAVRTAQARYLGTRLERFNGDFDAPVLLCGGLGCAPMSPSYEILATGCLAADPGPPKKPQRPPLAEADSATSVRLKWVPPPLDLEALDPPIEGYWLAWRGGGHRNLAWKQTTFVSEGAATVYDLVLKPGGATTVKSPWLQFTVSGLASHVPYEFRFAAVNELGIGPWSDPSPACQTPVFAGNLPKNQALLNMDQWLLRLGQGDPSFQALLLSAKELKLIDVDPKEAARLAAKHAAVAVPKNAKAKGAYAAPPPLDLSVSSAGLRLAVRSGEKSEFTAVQELLALHRAHKKKPRHLDAFGQPPPHVDPKVAGVEADRASGVHPYGSLTNLTPRFEGSGAPHVLTAPVRKQMLPFFPSSAGVDNDFDGGDFDGGDGDSGDSFASEGDEDGGGGDGRMTLPGGGSGGRGQSVGSHGDDESSLAFTEDASVATAMTPKPPPLPLTPRAAAAFASAAAAAAAEAKAAAAHAAMIAALEEEMRAEQAAAIGALQGSVRPGGLGAKAGTGAGAGDGAGGGGSRPGSRASSRGSSRPGSRDGPSGSGGGGGAKAARGGMAARAAVTGGADRRQEHRLRLRSAYDG